MLFKRRDPPTLAERIRVTLWPRRSWARSTRYVLGRIWRLRGSSHAIALGCAYGVFVSFTPYMGFHFLLAGLLAWVSRANVIASAFGTFVGNPLTFPFIWIATYNLGNLILGEEGHFNARTLGEGFEKLWAGIWGLSTDVLRGAMEILWPLIKPMTIGGIPLGALAGAIFYYLTKRAVDAYQARRRQYIATHPQDRKRAMS